MLLNIIRILHVIFFLKFVYEFLAIQFSEYVYDLVISYYVDDIQNIGDVINIINIDLSKFFIFYLNKLETFFRIYLMFVLDIHAYDLMSAVSFFDKVRETLIFYSVLLLFIYFWFCCFKLVKLFVYFILSFCYDLLKIFGREFDVGSFYDYFLLNFVQTISHLMLFFIFFDLYNSIYFLPHVDLFLIFNFELFTLIEYNSDCCKSILAFFSACKIAIFADDIFFKDVYFMFVNCLFVILVTCKFFYVEVLLAYICFFSIGRRVFERLLSLLSLKYKSMFLSFLNRFLLICIFGFYCLISFFLLFYDIIFFIIIYLFS